MFVSAVVAEVVLGNTHCSALRMHSIAGHSQPRMVASSCLFCLWQVKGREWLYQHRFFFLCVNQTITKKELLVVPS